MHVDSLVARVDMVHPIQVALALSSELEQPE
jgi:hypothetical protein